MSSSSWLLWIFVSVVTSSQIDSLRLWRGCDSGMPAIAILSFNETQISYFFDNYSWITGISVDALLVGPPEAQGGPFDFLLYSPANSTTPIYDHTENGAPLFLYQNSGSQCYSWPNVVYEQTYKIVGTSRKDTPVTSITREFQFTSVNTRPRCYQGKVYVRSANCPSGFDNRTLPPFIKNLTSDYGRCSSGGFIDNDYCGRYELGYTDNVVRNSRGEVAWNSYWEFPLSNVGSDGIWTNQGVGKGFTTTSRLGEYATRTQLIDLRAQGFSEAFLDSNPVMYYVFELAATISITNSVDRFRWSITLLNASKLAYKSEFTGTYDLRTDGEKSNLQAKNIQVGGGSLRYIKLEEGSLNTLDTSGPTILATGISFNLNECLDNNGGCGEFRICVDRPTPPAQCSDCVGGYELVNNTCVKRNPCDDASACPPNATCTADLPDRIKKCTCFVGYNYTGTSCQDINECTSGGRINGSCASGNCYNVEGATSSIPICLPVALPCSLGFGTNARNCTVSLPDNNANHNMTFLLNASVSSLTVSGGYFGPANDPDRFLCTIATVSGTLARCVPPAGVFGNNLFFTFRFCSTILVGQCFDVSFRNAGVFNHPFPIINSGTLRLLPSGNPSTAVSSINNAGGEQVSFTGSFFIASQYLSLAFTVQIRNNVNSYPCPLKSGTNQNTIVCEIQPGQGVNFLFEILWDGVVVEVGTDSFSYPVTPIVLVVSGCSNNTNNSTSNCPTSDLPTPTVITVQGANFGVQGYVSVAGLNCRNVSFINSTLLTCTLPQGVGLQLPITVSSGIFVSLPAFAVSYALPAITSVTGCVGSSLSPNMTTTNCKRDGSSVLTINGNNFGSQTPSVTVGGVKCTEVTMVTAHVRVTCKMPRVIDVQSYEIVIQQFDGQESQPPYPSVTYVQCPAGSSNANVACVQCEAGKYSSTQGQNCVNCLDGSAPNSLGNATSCIECNIGTAAKAGEAQCNSCGPGKFAEQKAKSTCVQCAGGRYSTGNQNSICEPCARGRFQSQEGQAECLECHRGRYADFPGLSECPQCQPGKYTNQTGTGEAGCALCPAGYSQQNPGQLSCAKCAVGKQATRPGRSTCDLCPSGRYAEAEASAVCTPCLPGFFQPDAGQTSCSPCAFGTEARESGSAVCANCLEGSFGVFSNTTGSSACMLCKAGYSQPAPSQSACAACAVGKFSEAGASTCKQCQAGSYASAEAASACQPCPIGAKPDYLFANCLCPVGTFSQAQDNNSGIACSQCPTGAVCTTTGVTEQGLLTEAGWWRAASTLNFYRCRFPELCLGGLGNVCGFAREGPLCAICVPGYSSNGPGKPCTLCPDQKAAWGETVGIMLLVLAVILVMMLLMLRYSNMQQRALIALTKANDMKALQQMQETLKEYEVGDDYFEKIREMKRKEENTTELDENETQETGEEEETGSSSVAVGKPPLVLPPVKPHETHEDFQEMSWAQNFRLAYKSAMEKAKVVGMLDAFVLESTKQLKNKLRRAPNFIYKVKILLGFFQVATIMPLNGIVNWPLYWSRFISAFSFFNFDFIPWSSLSCATSISYLDKALIIGCVPIAAVIFIAIVVFVWDKSTYKYGIETQMEIQMHQRQVWRQFTKLVLFTVFLLYPFSSKVTLGVYNCVTVEGQTYVAADFTLNCSDPYYIRTASINAIFVLLYPIGVPVACFFLLYKNLHRLREPETVLQFGFLYDAYTDDRWFWEIFDMTHKLCLTSITLFLPSNIVMPTNMCIIVVYFIGLVLANPYIRKGDDRFHLLVQVNLYLLALIGLILITIENPYRTAVADEQTMIILLSALLIVMNVGLFIGFFIIAGRNALKIIRGNQRAKKVAASSEFQPHPAAV